MLDENKTAALASQTWPFMEAERILKRIGWRTPKKGYVLFETGYGPSGLPHIGTFGEVVRTTMVRNAFKILAPEIPTRLFCVSDDMDGLRKVPDNLPNPEMLKEYLGKPLTSVPDPFGTHESYGHHMNARLRAFLDHFKFEYEFHSSTDNYKAGLYDEKLLLILKNYQKVLDVMLPTLGADRQKTYSPFMPVSPTSGRVLQVPIISHNTDRGTVTFIDDDNIEKEVSVTGGNCKLQWKPDFGMRWAALDVDYEMFGKDHQVSAVLYSAICRIAGGTPPEQFVYEMFLDNKGEKISKSRGNGLTIDEWLKYAPQESLAYYMYQSPRKAKKLHFDVIPKAMDEYLSFLNNYKKQTLAEQYKNPVWHIHNGNPPTDNSSSISFALLLNLASVCHGSDPKILLGFVKRYLKDDFKESGKLDEMVNHAVQYYHDFIANTKKYRAPSENERNALSELAEELKNMPDDSTAEILQNKVFAIGTKYNFEPMRDWFTALYEVLLGQSQGPRFGSFAALYGKDETAKLIMEKIA